MQTPIDSTDRITAMPDEETLAATVAALAARGFGAEVVDDLGRGSSIGKILEIHQDEQAVGF